MSVVVVLAAAVLGWGSPQTSPPQDPVTVPRTPEARVDDVVVEGRRLEDAASDFVGEVAAPVGDRGLARWHYGVCVGVVNLHSEVAQYIADRVSTVAIDVGLKAGEPGCKPNILVVGTDDGKTLARNLVASKRSNFNTGASGTNLSRRALGEFQNAERPVRWWQVSLPVDSETGEAAVRLPGRVVGDGSSVTDYAPRINVFAASRLNSQIRDDLRQSLVIVDVDELGTIDFAQVSDYVAMVALAQIDPEAETTSFNSILNLFNPATSPVRSLTEWDMAYLTGLYEAERNRVSRGAQVDAVASGLARARRDMPDAEPGQDAEE